MNSSSSPSIGIIGVGEIAGAIVDGLCSRPEEAPAILLSPRNRTTAGELAALLPIARPGVSRHLKVLREAGLVEVRRDAQRRVYSLRAEPLAELDAWLGRYRGRWAQPLGALHTEIARGHRARRSTP